MRFAYVSFVLLATAAAADAPIAFRETGAIGFVLQNGAAGEKHMIETMAGGLAIFDYDNDGKPDLYFTNGASVPSLKKDSPKFANRLYHNEGGMRFREISGAPGEGYSMGAAAADFDNDGNADLFVAGVYCNRLYRNLGGGKFEDVTARSGIRSDQWSVTAAWVDIDNDGLLDLFVVNYGSWPGEKERYCGDKTRDLRIYCHPKYYDPQPNQLYRNRGDGTFEDIAAKSGVAGHKGRGMGVAIADYDRDGKADIFVTNDNSPNFLFHNVGGGKFQEAALLSGVAFRDNGQPIAAMGTDFRDYDNDGWPDLVFVALTGETYPVMHNQRDGTFQDATYSSRMGPLTIRRAGWGAVWADFDNDGWKDIFTSNSHVNDIVERFEPTTYKQPNSVMRNERDGRFSAVESNLDKRVAAHRGLAVADLDSDGKLDAVVSVLGEQSEIWQNTSPSANHWIELRLQGGKSNRSGIGAQVQIGNQYAEMTSTHGYASSSLTPLHFGLGAAAKVSRIEIRWPSGAQQVLENVEADRVLTVKEP